MIELLRSTLITSPHGFPTRAGGVSEGLFASLNLSFTVGDDPSRVEQNLDRLARALGATPDRIATVHQVHGTTVLEATQAAGQGTLGEADALITSTPGLAVGVKTADCLPIVIEDRRTHAVAAVHAGWRGVIGGITAKTIARLVTLGSRVDDLRVAVGPAIQACCFEVDGDLPERFAAEFGPGVVRPQPGKPKVHLDLGVAVRVSLERVGVAPTHVEVLPQCTRCDPRFFSHRRDQGLTGRHLSLIRCAARAS
jgi:hypothetical protein